MSNGGVARVRLAFQALRRKVVIGRTPSVTLSVVDVYEIRRSNLQAAIEKVGGKQVELERLTGTPANYFSQVLSEKTQRRMGDAVARKIERALDLPVGWMDQVMGINTDLSPKAQEVGRKFDELPESTQAKVAHYIDVIHRVESIKLED